MSCYLFGFSFNKDTKGKWELILPLDWYQAPVVLPEEAAGGCLHHFWNKALSWGPALHSQEKNSSGWNSLITLQKSWECLVQEGELLTALQVEQSWLRSRRSNGAVLESSPAERQSWQGHLVTAGCFSWCKALHLSTFQGFFSFSFT